MVWRAITQSIWLTQHKRIQTSIQYSHAVYNIWTWQLTHIPFLLRKPNRIKYSLSDDVQFLLVHHFICVIILMLFWKPWNANCWLYSLFWLNSRNRRINIPMVSLLQRFDRKIDRIENIVMIWKMELLISLNVIASCKKYPIVEVKWREKEKKSSKTLKLKRTLFPLSGGITPIIW